jgi:hypothetical protein
MFTRLLASAVLAFSMGAAHADAFFSDNFDSNPVAGLNSTPTGWTIGNTGTVDIDAGGTCKSGVGRCIDLDGSTNSVGLLQRTFALVGGRKYTLSFDMAGGYFTGNTVAVNFGSASLNVINLAATFVYNTYTLQFSPVTSGNYTLSFLNNGGTASDNSGAYLDNVAITVPEPGTLAIAALALGALALSRRKAVKPGPASGS